MATRPLPGLPRQGQVKTMGLPWYRWSLARLQAPVWDLPSEEQVLKVDYHTELSSSYLTRTISTVLGTLKPRRDHGSNLAQGHQATSHTTECLEFERLEMQTKLSQSDFCRERTGRSAKSMEASKVKPAGGISRDDVRHTLHTHFHSTKPNPRPSTGGAPTAVVSRKRVFSFLQVQKPKAVAETKRLFGHGANAVKYFVLCVTVQDSSAAVQGGGAQLLELHYVQLMSNLSVDVRHSWNLSALDTIEHNGIGPDKTRGAFALFFAGETTSWQWLVETRESATAMHEFLWSVCAIAVQNNTSLPRLVRINVEELHDTASKLKLQKAYDVDVDLVRSVVEMKKNGSLKEDTAAGKDGAAGKKAVDNNAGIDVTGLRLASPESDEALSLLNDVNWNEVQLSAVEDDLRKKLRALEDENIAFLLSLDGDASVSPLPAAGATRKTSSRTSSVDKILEAIDALQQRITLIQDWTNESDESLGQTSSSMRHFEALNNQLEMHFKNSVSLEEVLAKLMAQVEVPQQHMKIFLSPVDVFPAEVGGSTTSVTTGSDDGRDVGVAERMRTVIAAITAMDQAIKSSQAFPAREMIAFRARGDELSKLVKD
ncbi:hypothetical protein ON010_g1851 [Phytophthora cinnamomi]|nr:hypothetical protein ON010_g1851 [Phytophthora cinnamomi]